MSVDDTAKEPGSFGLAADFESGGALVEAARCHGKRVRARAGVNANADRSA